MTKIINPPPSSPSGGPIFIDMAQIVADVVGIPWGTQTLIPGLSFVFDTEIGHWYELTLDTQGFNTSNGSAGIETRMMMDGVVLKSNAHAAVLSGGELVGGGTDTFLFQGIDTAIHTFEVSAYMPAGGPGDTMDWRAYPGSPTQFALKDLGTP